MTCDFCTMRESQLAKRFGVSTTTISNIQAGRRWSWLSEEVAA